MKFLSLSLLVLFTAISAPAAAQSLYDWNHADVPVLVETGSKLIFIGKTKAPVRVYTWKASKGKNKRATFFTDLDKDGAIDVVGAGKPLFTLTANSDPVKFDKGGCAQALVADFTADNKMDIACINGGKVKMFTHDLQRAWDIKFPRNFKWCRAGDVNGDLKADIECNYGKKWARIDGSSGEQLAVDTTTEEVNNPVNPSIEPISSDSLNGKTMYDLDGDGTKKEGISKDGKSVFLGSKKLALDAEPVAALVKDLDGDKKPEVIILTKKSVYVSNGDASKSAQFKLGKSFKRTPKAELKSVYANGFKDDKAAQEVVNKANDKLSKCYANQVRKNQFAGTGQILVEVTIDKKGKVKKVQQHHSSLADKSVGKCAKGALKKLKFPEPAGDAGSVNVTMYYTFEDN